MFNCILCHYSPFPIICYSVTKKCNSQKHSTRGVLQKRCSWKFRKIHRKTPMPESATLLKKRLWHRCIPVNFVKSLRTPFFHRTTPVTASEFSDVDLSSKRTLSSVLRFLKGKRFTDNFYILLLAVIGFFSRVG